MGNVRLRRLRFKDLNYAPINVKPAGLGGGGGGGRLGIGQGFDRSPWPGGRHLNYLAVPGVGIFEFCSCP